jgi:outer membrane protein assembly factor BamB
MTSILRKRRAAGMVAAAAGAMVLSGCWPAPGVGPNRDAFNQVEGTLTAANVASLTQVWAAPLDGPVFEPQNAPSGELVTGHGGIYVNDTRGAYRFDAATGRRDWKMDLPAFPDGQIAEMGQVLVAGQDVLVGYGSVGDWNGNGGGWGTRVLDPVTGTERGITIPGGMPVAQRGRDLLVAANQCVEGVSCNATYFRVDMDTGFGSRGTIGPNLNSYQPPTLGADRIYSTTFTTQPAPASLVQAHPRDGNPASPVWVTNLHQFAGASAPVLSPDGSTLYVGTSGTDGGEGHTLFALDAATGTVKWSTDVGHPVTASPALAHGVLYVPTASGLVAVDDQGTIRWRSTTGGWISGQPAVAAGVVYTGASDGTVRAFATTGCAGAATCDNLWSNATGNTITSAPIVSDGHLYVVSATNHQTGRVLAFAPH